MDVGDLLDLRPLRCRLNTPVSESSTGGLSEVVNDQDDFHVQMDCSHFSSDELTVELVDGSIVVHGKHEEKQDKYGYIKREFTRCYVIPENMIAEQMNWSLDANGLLTIKVPQKPEALKGPGNETIPIEVHSTTGIKDGRGHNK